MNVVPGTKPKEDIQYDQYSNKGRQPKFYSEYIYFNHILKIEKSKPAGSYDVQRKFLEVQLAEVNFFFQNNRNVYEYFRMRCTHLDEECFTRHKIDIEKKCGDFD